MLGNYLETAPNPLPCIMAILEFGNHDSQKFKYPILIFNHIYQRTDNQVMKNIGTET
jgi:hypothetical protein